MQASNQHATRAQHNSTGDCNLEKTQGQCVWLNSAAISKMNAARKSNRTPLTPSGLIPTQEGW